MRGCTASPESRATTKTVAFRYIATESGGYATNVGGTRDDMTAAVPARVDAAPGAARLGASGPADVDSGIGVAQVQVKSKANRGPTAGPANRRALIDAARAIFANNGPTAPLSSIAKRAGVGQASLYRHFPDRIAIVVAVLDENVAAIEEHVRPGDHGLDDLFDAVTAHSALVGALIDLMVANRHDDRARLIDERWQSVVTRIRERELARGRIGAHVDATDVRLAVGMLARAIAQAPEAERDLVAERSREIFRVAFAPRLS